MNKANRTVSRSLIFSDPYPTCDQIKIKQKNTFDSIIASAANIGAILSNTIDSTFINTQKASIANMYLDYDHVSDTTVIENLSKNLVLRTNTIPFALVSNNGDTTIANNLDIIGKTKMTDCNVNGNIEANNINLLGDLISTNLHATNNLSTEGSIISKHAHILGNTKIGGHLISDGGISTNNLEVTETFKTNIIETPCISSQNNLNLVPAINRSVNIPNIRYNTNIANPQIIGPIEIKSSKIFIVNRNIILESDESCDGIEIIIYNKNMAGSIIIRNITNIIIKLDAQCGVKLIYLFLVNRWAKI